MPEQPRVALLVETARGFGRDFLRGVARYAQLHGPWSFHITAGDYRHAVPKMRTWGGAGIIARIPDEQTARAILEANVPTVALGLTDQQMQPDSPLAAFSEVSSDPRQVASMAAEHLLQRRFQHFAYVGLDDRAWSQRREIVFTQLLTQAGFRVHSYKQPKRVQDRVWEREQAILARWLDELPRPVGLFACNDDRGREVLEACTIAGLRVPEDVAVVGVDNDEVFCALANPPLSSVALNAETAGYRAAELLDGMMSGKVRKPKRIVVEALHVVTRRSSDIVAVEDPDVAAALQFIHREKGCNISVDSVVEEVAVSRRHLEKRFRETIGRTILDEIQFTRLERAKRLLLETTFPVSKVADFSGFGTAAYFIQFFQRRVGVTPRRYRQELGYTAGVARPQPQNAQ
ncbi:MAG: XylR family transcriptional regulator [Pirellulales bacterium]|nr:XylR family transcriptional regulator [Pirellulales bacterium]